MLITPEIAALVSAYRTCELLTISASGVPIAWPVCGLYRPTDGTFVFSTSIGFPQKALNLRRDPRVALLFSDPTASGLDSPDTVLVQGTATVSEGVQTGFVQYADLWMRQLSIQPGSKAYSSTAPGRALMDVYYLRLFITVTLTAVTRTPALATGSFDGELRHYGSVVIAGFDDAGLPTLSRATSLSGLTPGITSVLAHKHNAKLTGQRSVVLTGVVNADGTFVPERTIHGSSPLTPVSLVRLVRGLRATGARYLARRGLSRPAVDWDNLRVLLRRLK